MSDWTVIRVSGEGGETTRVLPNPTSKELAKAFAKSANAHCPRKHEYMAVPVAGLGGSLPSSPSQTKPDDLV